MSSRRLFALIVILGSAGMVFFAAPQLWADMVYQLVNYPLDQGGHTLSGTITTDGTIGDLGFSDFPVGYYNFRPQFGGHIIRPLIKLIMTLFITSLIFRMPTVTS